MNALDLVWEALPSRDSCGWATIADLATHLHLSRSRTGSLLGALVAEGSAETRRVGRVKEYRKTGLGIETLHSPLLSDVPAAITEPAA